MRRFPFRPALVLLISVLFVPARPALARETADPPTPMAWDPSFSTPSSSTDLAKSSTDTFRLYGGPGTNEGKFEDPQGVLPNAQGWFGVDRTYTPPKWHVSEFNAATLGGHGPGNHALWCGEPASEVPGWATPPGYGNSWNQSVVFTSPPLADPSQGQTVELDFYFHHESEPFYDYFFVEYDHDGQWQQVYAVDGTDADASGIFSAPGLRFADVINAPIVYSGGDYADGDRVRVRLRFDSDGGWSDEDGLWPTVAGAVQIDDIVLNWSDGGQFWDMESGWPEPWQRRANYAGDFAAVYPTLPEADACAHNTGPAVAFVDVGQDACPEGVELFDPDADCTTGGSLAPNPVDAGFPWSVNVTGGLSDGELAVWSEFWSPPIAWDLPGSADDGLEITGAVLAFDVYNRLPFQDNVFFVWHVRSKSDGQPWSLMRDRNFVYHGTETPLWQRWHFDVTDLLVGNPDSVQIALGVRDGQNLFWLPGSEANSSPHFDNVSLVKYGAGGATFSTGFGGRIDDYFLAHDGFPVSGTLNAATAASRDSLDIPFDMTGDIGHLNPATDTGDSIVFRVTPIVPGAEIMDLRMVWILEKNTFFEDAIRALPNRPEDENVVGGATEWSGEVLADSVRNRNGQVLESRYFFDLPDEDFLYPGDVLRYFLQATDDAGRVTTLPANTAGFADGEGYSQRFTVRGLPSIRDVTGAQPPRLMITQFGTGDGEAELQLALAQMGLVEGVDFDTYSRMDDFQAGIGSAGGHGATAQQLAGYGSIYYFADREQRHILNGDSSSDDEEYDDYATLSAWHDLPGPRSMAHFGDSFANSVIGDGGTTAFPYLRDVMGVDFWSEDVSSAIEDQVSPRVESVHPDFSVSLVALGGCPDNRSFDHIRPLEGAARGHAFVDLGGAAMPGPAASVIHDRLFEGYRKVDVTFSFAIASVRTPMNKGAGSRTRLSELLQEVDEYFGNPPGGSPTRTPQDRRLVPMLSAHPTPFNPRTTIELVAPATDDVRVEIFDLRGRRVRELFRGALQESGTHRLPWSGRDDRGASVSSGVYFVRATASEFRVGTRVVLLK